MKTLNKIQTPLTEELLDSLDSYVKRELLDAIDRIEFVQNLVNPNRLYTKDLKRWDNPYLSTRKETEDGRIAVSIENPHILEDMDYFRQAAIYFKENGRYTQHYKSKHPNSLYRKFWDEESRRCKDGYVRQSDGEWITGYNYYYWNYSPIMVAIAKHNGDDIPDDINNFEGQAAERVESFPFVWDMDYYYYHYLEQAEANGKYGAVLKTRGRGYSYKGGSLLGRNYNFFAGSKSWAFASDSGDLTEDGLLTKAWDNLDFINSKTAWGKKRQEKNTTMHKKASYLDMNTDSYKGYKSEILGLTTQNKPEKARGKRGKAILLEEAGRYLDLLRVWGIARPSMEQGKLVFGLMIAFGTGGTVGAAFEGLEKLFYESSGFRVHSLRNVFDKTKGQGRCAFYCGEYMNREGCYDKNGNSDVIKALIEIFYARLEVIKSTTQPSVVTQEKADRSITPQEAVMRVEGNMFPIADLKDYLSDIEPSLDKFVAPHYNGRLAMLSDKVEFVLEDKIPLRNYNISSKKDKKGCIEIFKKPVEQNNGKPAQNRYIIGVDPYDDDTGTSLGSCFIFDLWTDEIVAEYTGRPDFANDFYEIVRRLGLYYNAIINYENKNKGLFAYFDRHHCLHLLANNPTFLKGVDGATKRENYGNKAKGTVPTQGNNKLGRSLQRDWMLSKSGVKEDSNNLRQIRSVGYIKEAIAWNEDGNFDRVSAMGMVMIQREEMLKYKEHYQNEDSYVDLANDEFFNKN